MGITGRLLIYLFVIYLFALSTRDKLDIAVIYQDSKARTCTNSYPKITVKSYTIEIKRKIKSNIKITKKSEALPVILPS